MLCLRNAWHFQELFLIILSLFANLKLMSVLFIHEMFLVYKLETFTNCNEVKPIMVMIIAIIYIFYLMRYLINSWKLLSENPQPPPPPQIKSIPPFTHSPTKNSKSARLPPILPTLNIFQALSAERVGEGGAGGEHYAFFSKNGLILPNFSLIR